MNSQKPKFLLINDDGIDAVGIFYLWEALKDYADITIVAPDTERSGAGASLTIDKHLTVRSVPWPENAKAYKVSGTPVDCVKVGLNLFPQKPNLIISGVNKGANSGHTLFGSGTVGAVIAGVIRNVPGIAFSYSKFDNDSFDHVKRYIWPIVQYLSDSKIAPGSFYNVNFPEHPENEIKGLKVVPHGFTTWREQPKKIDHPEGHTLWDMNDIWEDSSEPEGTDVHYLKEGYITASPIRVAELTDYTLLSHHKEEFEESFSRHFS